MSIVVNVNGAICDSKEATISVFDHGFLAIDQHDPEVMGSGFNRLQG